MLIVFPNHLQKPVDSFQFLPACFFTNVLSGKRRLSSQNQFHTAFVICGVFRHPKDSVSFNTKLLNVTDSVH